MITLAEMLKELKHEHPDRKDANNVWEWLYAVRKDDLHKDPFSGKEHNREEWTRVSAVFKKHKFTDKEIYWKKPKPNSVFQHHITELDEKEWEELLDEIRHQGYWL